jgi:hypothetical protein
MRRLIAGMSICAAAVVLSPSVSAKGETVKIAIAGGDLSEPITLTDAEVLRPFNVWAGPGTGGTVNGVSWRSTEGFIIEWTAGTVSERPKDLPRYEVSFYMNVSNRFDSGPTYIVFYENDRATGNGYVYLPGRDDPQYRRNVFAIIRHIEGNWFHASRAWQSAVTPLLNRTAQRRR